MDISATEIEADECMHGLNIQDELRVNVPIFSYIKGCHKEEETSIFFMSRMTRVEWLLHGRSNSSKGKLD